MLDDAIDLVREAPRLERDRQSLLHELHALPRDRPDLWVRVAVDRARLHDQAPWLAVIALHLAADAQTDRRVALVLDETSVRIIEHALESATVDPLERTLLAKSLASAHLSVAEESVRLGRHARADAHLAAASKTVHALTRGPYREAIEHGVALVRCHAAPHHATPHHEGRRA